MLIGYILRGALVGSLAIGSVALAQAQEIKKGGTITLANDGPRVLNSAVQSGIATGIPAVQIFAGLIELDDKFQPLPYLAESWTISEDGKAYTFKLVEGAQFHDGKPVTSADVAFSIDVVKKNHPFGIAMFGAVEGIETPDARTAIIKLAYPQPQLMASLSPLLAPILPKHIFGDGQDLRTHPANKAPVGSGPFKFVEWKTDQHIILEKNPNYFRAGRPYLDRIVIKLIPEREEQTRLLEMQSGSVDYMPASGMNARNVSRIKNDPNIEITTRGFEALGATNYIEFNLRHKPLDDVRVRRAIAHAIDKDFITKRLHFGASTRMDGPLHFKSPFYDASVLASYPYDLKKAASLLDEAGQKPDANGTRFNLTLDIPTFNPQSGKLVAEYLKPQLAKVGINVTLRTSPDFATWANRIAKWDYEVTMNSIFQYPDPIIGVHRLFLCDNIKHVVWTNTNGYCNKRVDELLKAAARSTDPKERKVQYSEFQKIISEELPMIFTNNEPYTAAYRKYVRNVPLSVWGGLQSLDQTWLAK